MGGRLVRLLNVLFWLPLLLALLAPWIPPDLFWPAEFCAMGFPWLVLGLLLWVGCWAFFSRRWMIANLVVGVLASPQALGIVQMHGPAEPAESELRVMTMNAAALRYDLKNLDGVAAVLQREQPDILVVQESWLNTRNASKVLPMWMSAGGFKEYRQYKLAFWGFGLAVFSRFPITDHEYVTIAKDYDDNAIYYVEVMAYGRKIRVYDIHLRSYSLGTQQRSALDSLAESRKLKVAAMKGTLRKLKATWPRHMQQLEAFRASLPDTSQPVIVCADLNNPPYGYLYHRMAEGFKDSFYESGQGLGLTFGSLFSAFRIDYVMVSPHFDVLSHEVVPLPFSDHHGILTRIRLKTPAP